MKNTDELIAQLSQLHIDNEKRIYLLEKNGDRQHEALMYWLTKPWWKKLLGLK